MTFVCFLASAQTVHTVVCILSARLCVSDDTNTLFIFVSFCWIEIRHSHQNVCKYWSGMKLVANHRHFKINSK